MCTAVRCVMDDLYFGRTLDLDFSYAESVTITPRNYPFAFRHEKALTSHYAIIGMAFMQQGYPLYYDAVNEAGLAMAGLNFPGNACYQTPSPGKTNLAQFELIPWILGSCTTVRQARQKLESVAVVNTGFSPELPPTPMHWILSDREEALTLEPTAAGLQIHQNPVGVLTNNPPFPEQMFHLSGFLNLTAQEPVNRFAPELPLSACSRGMGAMGLPGDMSSQSRFVRAAFVAANTEKPEEEPARVGQFFHILGTVNQVRGMVDLGQGKYETTIYTSCCNAQKGIYYYTTYGNHQITAVDMYKEDLEGTQPVAYPISFRQNIHYQNG